MAGIFTPYHAERILKLNARGGLPVHIHLPLCDECKLQLISSRAAEDGAAVADGKCSFGFCALIL